MRCLTLLILIMTGLMDLFRRRPVWAGASVPPGTGPASARAEASLRALAVSVASRRTRRSVLLTKKLITAGWEPLAAWLGGGSARRVTSRYTAAPAPGGSAFFANGQNSYSGRLNWRMPSVLSRSERRLGARLSRAPCPVGDPASAASRAFISSAVDGVSRVHRPGSRRLAGYRSRGSLATGR